MLWISLLYAPSSGKETRQKIRDTSIDAKNRTVELAQQAASSARQGAQTLVEQGKESVHGIVDTSKERLHEAGEQVKDCRRNRVVKFLRMSELKLPSLSRALAAMTAPTKRRLRKSKGRFSGC